MHIKTLLNNHPQLKQLLGAAGGALMAVTAYYAYQLTSDVIGAHVLPAVAVVDSAEQTADVDERVTFERVGAVAREKLRGMQADEWVD